MIFSLLRLVLPAAVALALSLPSSTSSAPVTAPEAALKRPGCPTLYTRHDFRQAAGRALRVPPYTAREKRRLKRRLRCQHNPAGKPKLRRWLAGKKRAYRARFYWELQWQWVSPADKRWAHNVAACESGHNPRAHDPGGSHHGKYQFLLATARAAGFSGDPHLASVREQDVRAVWWMHRAGRAQWACSG